MQVLATEVYTTDEPFIALYHQIQILKAMELIPRSRLYITQSDFGLAARDIKAARDLLAELLMIVNAFQVETLTDIVLRLDLALESLSVAPDLAIAELEIAWWMMLGGLPVEPAATQEGPTFTPTLGEMIEGTPEVTADVTVTPTLTMTL